jgi:hypothetical protein
MATLLFRLTAINPKAKEAVLEDSQLQTKPLEQHLSPYFAIHDRYTTKFFCELEETELPGGGAVLVNPIRCVFESPNIGP